MTGLELSRHGVHHLDIVPRNERKTDVSRIIPNINTARLTLSAMRPEDFDRFAEIWSMPDVVRHLGGRPLSRGEAWESFLRNAGHWQMTGFGQWAISEQASRSMVGQAGFFFRARDLGDDFDLYPEAGWILSPAAQGRGFAFEATQAAHDWFDRIVTGSLVAMIAVGNAASLTLAERLGYREMRRAEFEGDPVALLRRDGPPGRR